MTAMMSKASSGSRHPARNLEGILSGSGLTAYLQACARHDVSAHDALHEAAAMLKRGIEKSGKKWMFGMDVKWKAWQITRPLRHAADLHLEAARSYHVCKSLFDGAFAEATRDRNKAGEFDPTK